MKLRKIYTYIEETFVEMGQEINPPVRKAVSLGVIDNPCAREYFEDLEPLFLAGEKLGAILGKKAIEALGVNPSEVHSYGKAAIVGFGGEIEHAAAVLHPRLGKSLRAEVNGGTAIIPSTKKIGGPGTSIDVPLFYKNAAFVVSHIDSVEVRASDAPQANEILVAIALTDSGRPLPRSGGLKVEEVIGQDGLR